MQEILLDNKGYEQYLKEIEKLKEEETKNSTIGSKAYTDAIGDGWHDNFAFEDSMRESRKISKRINDLISQKNYIKIINDKQDNKNLINIGDRLKIKVTYSKDDYEVFDVILTGNYISNTCEDITELTLNSPIGKSIYHKNKKDEIKGMINDKEIIINILEIL